MNYKIILLIIFGILSLSGCHKEPSLSSVISDFAVSYSPATRQLWFIMPLKEKDSYRIYVMIFNSRGEPLEAIFANEADYAGQKWHIRNGYEAFFDNSLNPWALKKIESACPELAYFSPKDVLAKDPRIKRDGYHIWFSEKSISNQYTNVSMFTLDKASQKITYSFTPEVNITSGKNKSASIPVGARGLMIIWPDSQKPQMTVFEGGL